MVSDRDSIQRQSVWQGIRWWMNEKKVSPAELERLTGHPSYRIERGINGEELPLPSSFLHASVDAFGLRNARNRSVEDATELLTDEECVQLLASPVTTPPRQGNFWNSGQSGAL